MAPLRGRAFTLVEVLVVTGILALLIGLLFPVLSRVRASGRNSVCVSNLHQLGQAVQLYAQDYDRYPPGLDPADKYTPVIWSGHPAAQGGVLSTTPLLHVVMSAYIKSPSLWHCPSDVGFDVVDVTGIPLDARPGCYDKFGMSYFYRSEITLLNLAEDHLPNPVETNILADADGLWHGSNFLGSTKRRYNVLFGDGHVKNVDNDVYLRAWDIPIQ